MDVALLVTVFVIIAAVAFDFVNGFHDAANSIATIIATKVLSPRMAVAWAAFFNFVAVFIFGTAVAKTVGSGLIDLNAVTPLVVLSGLLGAVIWGLVTWWLAIPTSSSHALLGGYAGAAMAHSAAEHGWKDATQPIIVAGWIMPIAFIVIAPVIGLVLAEIFMTITMAGQRAIAPAKADKFFSILQLCSSAFLSLMHGSNDAQKTAGLITGALVAAHYLPQFQVPWWVLILSYTAMALGTLSGGWRIVRTLGHDLTRIRPNGGVCAETAAALSILISTELALPVSTTHVTTGAVIGTGAARSIRLVRWDLAGRIAWAWVLTIPAAALLGAGIMGVTALFVA